jgi:phage-related protein
MICEVLYPASGAALAYNWTNNPGGVWETAGLIVKGSGTAVTLNMTNPGTVLAEKLALDLLGPIANPSITNTTNGTSITINTSVAGTKHLIVDTGAFTARNDGSNVIGSVAHSGAEPFLTLAPGVNVLQVSGAACTGATLVTVSFAASYE